MRSRVSVRHTGDIVITFALIVNIALAFCASLTVTHVAWHLYRVLSARRSPLVHSVLQHAPEIRSSIEISDIIIFCIIGYMIPSNLWFPYVRLGSWRDRVWMYCGYGLSFLCIAALLCLVGPLCFGVSFLQAFSMAPAVISWDRYVSAQQALSFAGPFVRIALAFSGVCLYVTCVMGTWSVIGGTLRFIAERLFGSVPTPTLTDTRTFIIFLLTGMITNMVSIYVFQAAWTGAVLWLTLLHSFFPTVFL